MLPARFELEARPGREVYNCSRHEDLARLSKGGDAVRGVYRDPDQIVRPELDLAGMQPGPQRDALLSGRVAPRQFQVRTARRDHAPGTPLRAHSPRVSNSTFDPSMSSGTAPDT